MTVALPQPIAWHRALAVVLLLAAAGLVVWHRVYRTVEMMLAGGLIRLFTSDGVYVAAERQSVYFGLGGDTPFGLRMSPECTSAFLLLPLLLVGLINWLGTDQGYYLGHTMFGSFVSVFGGAAALVLFVWLATRSPKKDPE